MVTSTVILSLLTTVIGYGFPSGNGFEPGTIHVGLPASAIPNITMSRDCVKSAVAARDPTWVPIDSTTVGLDQYFYLGAGTSPYLPLGHFNDFPGPPFTSVAATGEISTKVTRSPVIPTIVPTVKTPRINAYGPYDGRDTEASTSPIHHFTEELIVFYASGCNRKDRARDPTRPSPRCCQSEPPTWLGPAYRVLTFVTYVIPLTIIGLVASVLTIFVNAMIALTIALTIVTIVVSARAAAIVTFACMAARDLCVHYLSCTFYIMSYIAIKCLLLAKLGSRTAMRSLTNWADHLDEARYDVHLALKVCATRGPTAASRTLRAPSYPKHNIKSELWAHIACMARNLGCFSTSRVSQARVVATAVFIKLPMAYVFASKMRALSRWLVDVSATCDAVGRSQCRTCMTTMVACLPARARLSHFRPWRRLLSFVTGQIDYFIVRMLMHVALPITMFVNVNMSAFQFACFLALGPFTGVDAMPPSAPQDSRSKGPPMFSGERGDFIAWFMIFTAYVSFKLTRAASIAEGTRPRPANPPAAIMGRAQPEPLTIAGRGPRPPAIPVPVRDSAGTVTNQVEIDAATALLAAWAALPAVANQAAIDAWAALPLDAVMNQSAIDDAKKAQEDWDTDNMQLYGLLVQGLPTWLVTSVFNTHRNDGLKALESLRNSFDANNGDGGDHAAHLAKLQSRTIDGRCDVSEDDLRKHFDMMMTQVAAIQRTGNASVSEATLIAFYDNALPISYTNMRQHARRAKHATLIAHHSDMMSQVRAEVNARTPAVNAFTASGGHHGGGGGGGGGGPGKDKKGKDKYTGVKTCLRCGQLEHTRPVCKLPAARCIHCGADHLSDFCGRSTSTRRAKLAEALRAIIDKDTARQSSQSHPTPTYAAVAASSPVPGPSGPPPPSTPEQSSIAHAAAAQAAAAHKDPQKAADAYVAVLRGLGLMSFACYLDLDAYADLARTTRTPRPAPPPPPEGTIAATSFVDSMATYWIVEFRNYLYTITNDAPKFTINTANGAVPVEAVGVALVYLRVGDSWECYEIPNVLVLPGCGATLYSTRVMRNEFGFDHQIDHGKIVVPGAHDIPVHDDGAAYTTPIAFVPFGAPRPHGVHVSAKQPTVAALMGTAAFPGDVSGTPQAFLHHRLGFPYQEQWKHVPSATTDHGLPANAMAFPDLPVREAIARGRARAVPFLRKAIEDRTQPPPGAVFYMDFAGPLLPSIFHRFTCYACVVDAGSGYGRLYPAHHMTATVATAALDAFTAEMGAHMGFHGTFKPFIVRSDQGSAFVSHYFREFLQAHQIHQSLACVYTPQQNAHAERFFGVTFATARVLLAAANLPPSFHPFALQTAAWIHNRLPRPSHGNVAPIFTLTRALPSLAFLYCFGCRCQVVVPVQRRDGDRHFADRGEFALYLGPSEASPGSVVYLLSSRRITTIPKLSKTWEDDFPGLAGDHFTWFPEPDAPESAVGGAPPLPQSPASTSTTTDIPADSAPATPAGAPATQASATQWVIDVPPDLLAPPPVSPADTTTAGGASAQGGADASPISRREARNLRSELGPAQRGEPTVVPTQPSAKSQDDGRAKRPTAQRQATFIYGKFASLAKYPGFTIQDNLPALTAFALLCVAAAPYRIQPAFAYASNTLEVNLADPHASDFDFVWATALAAGASNLTITADLGNLEVPKSYRHALRSPQSDYWRAAIAKELAGLITLNTWDMVLASSMPPGANLMNCHYVFTVKRKKDGSIEKFKARLVADGNTQKFGVDFDRIFASVVKTSTIRLMLLLAAARDYNLSSIDITMAYLQADLDEDLFMRPPPNVHPFDSENRPIVCKLRRSLYGLRQAGRVWAILFASFLMSWGLVRSSIDCCLYTYTSPSGEILWIAVYVDDALICDNSPELRARFVADLSERFPTEDKGELSWILNVAITRDRPSRTISMSQALYVADLTTKFAPYLLDASLTRHFDCPMDEGLVLTDDDQPEVGTQDHEDMAVRRDAYMSLVGGLLWLANMSLPLIAYPTSQLARFLTNPGPSHFQAALRVLLYVRQHGNQPLTFAPNPAMGLDTFVDSSWDTRFSVSGCMIFFHGCLFHWFSKMQKSVSLSSAEAEYFGAMMAARDVIFIRDILIDLGITLDGPSVIFSDSKSAVDMSVDPVAFKKTKHILRAAEFLRDLVAREVIALKHLPGKIMLADVLTKAVARAIFLLLTRLIAEYSTTGIASPT